MTVGSAERSRTIQWIGATAVGAAILAAVLIAWKGLELLLDATTNGLSLGAIYALLALGFVIIFKATQVVNFAHGAIAALGAFFVAYFATVLNFPGRLATGLPAWTQWSLSVVVAVFVIAFAGLVIERVTIRPMVGEPLFAIAMVTIGLDIVVRTITVDFIGADPRPLGDPWAASTRELGTVTVADTEIVTFFAAIVLVAAVAWFFRSKTGVAMRATAFDQEAARAQGISVGRIFAISWMIGAALAGIAGVFSSLFPRAATGVGPTTAFFAFRAFPAIILGGLDSIVGAVVGGFAIGLAESFAGAYFTWSGLGSGFAGIVPYLVMMLVLLVRPYGLFGTEEIRRV